MSDAEERNNKRPGEDELASTRSFMDSAHAQGGKANNDNYL